RQPRRRGRVGRRGRRACRRQRAGLERAAVVRLAVRGLRGGGSGVRGDVVRRGRPVRRPVTACGPARGRLVGTTLAVVTVGGAAVARAVARSRGSTVRGGARPGRAIAVLTVRRGAADPGRDGAAAGTRPERRGLQLLV